MQFHRLFAYIAVAAGLAAGLTGCGDKGAEPAKTASSDAAKSVELVVGVSPVPHADIMNFVKPALEKEGVQLKLIEFSDYVQPNIALAEGELDANFFQHKPYLDEFAKEHNLKLASLVAVHIEPMGVYSKSVKAIADVPQGAKVAIPNDPTNGGRALKVLETAGLLKLRPEAGILATRQDVTENPKSIEIIEIEAAQLPRSLEDVALAVINCNFALGAGLNPMKDAIALEGKDSPYVNIVAIRAGDAGRPELASLKKALTTPAMKKFIEEKYKGSIIPTF